MSVELLWLAWKKLEATNIQHGLPGRENKITEIYDFLFNRLKVKKTAKAKRAKIEASQYKEISKHDNKTLMICGIPGTGKTVTVKKVLDQLEEVMKQKDSPIEPFRHVFINGHSLRKPNMIYSEILHQLTDQICSTEKAQERLEALFTTSSQESNDTNGKRKRRTIHQDFKGYTVIVVDELDMLYNERRQTLFYSLFEWPSRAEVKVIVIGIANALNLTERFIKSGKSRCGWEKCVFEPYSSDNLQSILETRLGADLLNKTFAKNALVIATKRIGRTTGDARRILDTCRMALVEAVAASESEGKYTKVTPAIIDSVGFQNRDKHRAKYVQCCTPMELFILKSILVRMNQVGEENLDTVGLYQSLLTVMKKHPKFSQRLPTMDQYKALMNTLAALGMITLDMNAKFDLKKFYLNEDNDALKDLIHSERIEDHD